MNTDRPLEYDSHKNKYLTVEEVATIMKISPKTIYDWCAKGYLPCIKLGRLVRIDKDDLMLRIEEIKQESAKQRR